MCYSSGMFGDECCSLPIYVNHMVWEITLNNDSETDVAEEQASGKLISMTHPFPPIRKHSHPCGIAKVNINKSLSQQTHTATHQHTSTQAPQRASAQASTEEKQHSRTIFGRMWLC
jgi:hypothetical protein